MLLPLWRTLHVVQGGVGAKGVGGVHWIACRVCMLQLAPRVYAQHSIIVSPIVVLAMFVRLYELQTVRILNKILVICVV